MGEYLAKRRLVRTYKQSAIESLRTEKKSSRCNLEKKSFFRVTLWESLDVTVCLESKRARPIVAVLLETQVQKKRGWSNHSQNSRFFAHMRPASLGGFENFAGRRGSHKPGREGALRKRTEGHLAKSYALIL